MLTATAATYWISALALGQPVLPAQIPAGAWFGLIGVGIVSTFIAVLAFYGGAHRIGAARASIVSTVEPIWTIVLASLLFQESLGPAAARRRRDDPARRRDRADRRRCRLERGGELRIADE